MMSYLKIFNYSLKMKKSFFFHFIKNNVFEILDNICLIVECIITRYVSSDYNS